MAEKHRWYDVIVAWANGEKIQYRNEHHNHWSDYSFSFDLLPRFNCDGTEWRIKPKMITKKYRMALVKYTAYEGCTCVDITESSIDDPVEYNIQGFIRWVGDVVEVEVEV